MPFVSVVNMCYCLNWSAAINDLVDFSPKRFH